MLIFNLCLGAASLLLPLYLYKTFLTVIEARERKSSVQKVEHVVETELILAQA